MKPSVFPIKHRSLLRLLAVLIGVALLLPALASAQPMLVGTTSTVNAGPGDQLDPHIDCNLASYTDDQAGVTNIRTFNFTTNTDAQVPVAGTNFLSDVSGSRVVFTNVTAAGSRIAVFDTATSTSTTIPGGNQRTQPGIGSTLVAFEDRSFSSNPNQSEIVAHDLALGTTTRITSDAPLDQDPAVSPTGSAVVFTKCQTTGLGCDIYAARQTAPGVFVTTALTGPAGEDTNADTNGTLAVYTSVRGGEANIFYQPITGGSRPNWPFRTSSGIPASQAP